MVRKWKIVISVVFISLVARCSEPFVEEWYYKEACSFGSVSKEEYAKIRSKAKIVFQSWDWKNRKKWEAAYPRATFPAMTAFLETQLKQFIPSNAAADVRIAHFLAFMDGMGARLTYMTGASFSQTLRPKDISRFKLHYKRYPDFNIDYLLYRVRVGEFDPMILLPQARFYEMRFFFEKNMPERKVPKKFAVLRLGLNSGFKGSVSSVKRIGCLTENIFRNWGIKW